MNERISNKLIREDKIKKLKRKILIEITKELNIIKEEMRKYLFDNKIFSILAKESFVLLNLKEYIEDEYTFQSYEAEFPDKDIVIYTVSDKNLSIWLQDDYSFVSNFYVK